VFASGSDVSGTAARFLFVAACLQVAFLWPYVVLIPTERTNIFSGLLCLASGLMAWLARGRAGWRTTPVLLSCALAGLALLGGVFGLAAASNTWRSLVLLGSGMGGYWSGRLLLTTGRSQRMFVWLCAAILAGLLLLCAAACLCGHPVHDWVDTNPHPLVARLVLLGFAPLALLYEPGAGRRTVAVLLMAGTIVVMVSTGLRSGAAACTAAVIAALLCRALSPRVALLLLLATAAGSVLLYRTLPDYKPAGDRYRLESYAFSWHVAAQHPLLGIGIRSPREGSLAGYRPRLGGNQGADFAQVLRELQTPENMYLTLMSDLGLPFALLYTYAIAASLFARLMQARRRRAVEGAIPAAALFIPMMAVLAHFAVFDGLLHPQVAWFFHVLLGMRADAETRSGAEA
jgi:hypothetical protein